MEQLMSDRDRQDLLLYLINQTGTIETYTKFFSIMCLLKHEANIFNEYQFDKHFLSLIDQTLANDLTKLLMQNFVTNDEKMHDKGTHEHQISIDNSGKSYLDFFEIENKLKRNFGDKIDQLSNLIITYNSMPNNTLIKIISEKKVKC